MAWLKTKYQRQSAGITSVIAVILLLLLFFVGLNYFDPPIEYAMEVNFGTSNVGSGNKQPKAPLKPATNQPKQNTPKEAVKETVKEQASTKSANTGEKVLTQEEAEAIAIRKAEEEAKRKADAEEAKRIALEEAKRKEEERKKAAEEARKERIRKEQEAKKAKLDALMGGIGKTDGTETGGEGDDSQDGDKGQIDGNPYANTYYGNPGPGGGSDYGLNGRSIYKTGEAKQNCNEEGRVVVAIVVDQSGKVVSAKAGVRGTTNNHPCLLAPAKQTALGFRWNADQNAPAQQKGFIVINFSLSE
ncbi:energy transducer TonB [Sungkyunkwania multivorans]|uniref:Energy transducer TonB n=1 Tax=Sungkyunkwania multivorans TaxID=1173618 RepID=A0ABW3CYH8_9FLAO